jgi:pantetheine-phosphate adenylyltransferase
MVRAVYAGTFDPVTFGHLDVIERASKVFDELVITTTENVNKTAFFTRDERLALLQATLDAKPGIEVRPFDGLLVDFAREIGAKVLVRGLRAASDFEYEFEMAMMNRELWPEIEIVFFVTRPRYMFVSSTLIREIAGKGGDISPFVPPPVQDAIITKLGHRETGV